MVINTNIASANATRYLNESSIKLQKSLDRLSSGKKITSPEDDAGGLAVSMRFDAQINRLKAASTNIGNTISYSQAQDGFLQKVATALDRMSELTVLAQDVTKSDTDRSKYNTEFSTLKDYINNIGKKNFNGVSIFDGTSKSVTIDDQDDKWSMTGVSLGSTAYTDATAGSLGVSTASGAADALIKITAAINQLATDRSQVGANITRLTQTNDQLAILKTNLAAANSRIKDVNVAEESTELAKYQILVQAGTAMLAQANSSPKNVLNLLG